MSGLGYALFFAGLSGVSGVQLASGEGPASWLWLWPLAATAQMAAAYGFARPEWVCGKRHDGALSPWRVLVALPWLAFTWTVWALQARLSRENGVQEFALQNGLLPAIHGTGLPKG